MGKRRIVRMLAGAVCLGTLGQAWGAPPQAWTEPVTGMPFVAVPKGCFRMGTGKPLPPRGELNWGERGLRYRSSLSADEQPKHEVCVDAFWMGQYEVRADDWLRVMGTPPPAGTGPAPASGVTWKQAREFAARLTELSGGAHAFRLPTEAEWEYACRAGSKKDTVPDINAPVPGAWYSGSVPSIEQPGEVGRLVANAWGLHDMLGNVWEWVQDDYQADAYRRHRLYNPVAEGSGGERVIRGASHRSHYLEVRCANRGSYPADDSLRQIGLRLVRSR